MQRSDCQSRKVRMHLGSVCTNRCTGGDIPNFLVLGRSPKLVSGSATRHQYTNNPPAPPAFLCFVTEQCMEESSRCAQVGTMYKFARHSGIFVTPARVISFVQVHTVLYVRHDLYDGNRESGPDAFNSYGMCMYGSSGLRTGDCVDL